MNRKTTGAVLACLLIAGVAAAFFFARTNRRQSLLTPLPNIELEQFRPTARKLIADMIDQVRREPLRADRWGELGLALLGNNAQTEAAACFARAEEIDPENHRWAHLYGRVLIATDKKGAVAALERANALRPNVVPTIGSLVEAYLEDQEIDKADRLLRPFATEKLSDQRLLTAMARIEAARGKIKEAIAFAERAAAQSPTRKQIHDLLAQLHARQGGAAAARHARIAELLRNVEEAPWPDPFGGQAFNYSRNLEQLAMHARSLVRQGRPGEAIALIEDLTPEEKTSSICVAALAIAHAHSGDAPKAEALLRSGDEKDPNIAFARGVVAMAQEKFDEGARAFEAAATLQPAQYGAKAVDSTHVNRAMCLLALDKEDEAIKAYEQALSINPGNVGALLSLAELYIKKGRKNDAARILKDADLLEPDNPNVKELMRRAAA